MTKYYFSPAKQKILLILLAGVSFAFSRSPKNQWYIIRNLPRALYSIDKAILRRILREFYRDRLVDFRAEKDGTSIIVLTDRGRKRALRYKIDSLSITIPNRWDKIWRIVVFDIPEKHKKAREALRHKLSELGFIQFQKSAWVFPFRCKDEIDFIVEIFEIRSYVQYLEVVSMTNDAKLKLHFGLS